MSQATELIARQMAAGANIKKVWGTIIFNVKDLIYVGGAVGNGTTDDTSAVQAAVNDAVSKNATLVFFPPGTYKVTALTNASTINFVGDNATFVGYAGTILQFGLSTLTIKNTLTPVYNIIGYGAKGDGVTDDAAAIQSAFNAATTANGILYFPSGNFISSTKITSSGKNVAIQGSGLNVSRIIFTTANGGFDLNFDPQGVNVPPQQLFIADLAIESRAAVSSPAISAAWTTYQPNAQGQLWIENVQITRKNDGTGSFVSAIKLNKAITGVIRSCVILGDESRVSLTGIDLVDCIGIKISDTDINRYQTGVSITKSVATQTEGVYISNCTIYDVYKGILVNTALHIQIINVHININGLSASECISMVNVNQSVIIGCLLYAGGNTGDPVGQNIIELGSSTTINVQGNNMIGLSLARTTYGIVLSGNSGYCVLSGNYLTGLPTGISFGTAGDSLNTVIGNQFNNVTTPIGDAAPNNLKAENTSNGTPVDSVRWGTNAGAFRSGELSTNANWGGFLQGYSGSSADLAFADSTGGVVATIRDGSFKVKSYVKTALPIATTAGGIIYVSNDVGGPTLAFSNGTNWLRVKDNAIIA